MAQRAPCLDLIDVPATRPLPDQIAAADQIADEPLRRALGNAHIAGNIAQTSCRVAGNTEQDERVVAEERPCVHRATRASPRVVGFAAGPRCAAESTVR